MLFTKMQSNGNDYIYIDLHAQTLPSPRDAAIHLSDRHFGIGGDGIVLLCPSATADFRMRIFDPDGTEAEMCGNALQSSAVLYALDHKVCKNRLRVETNAGIKHVFLTWNGPQVTEVSAEIGTPDILFCGRKETICEHEIMLSGISFGNPHLVVFTDDLSDGFVFRFGPLLEKHPLFADRTNVEFCSVKDRCHFEMRTWERGCGETLSCSTGSAAALVASVMAGIAERDAIVIQRGGSIRVNWSETNNTVRIYSKTRIVFRGTINETELSNDDTQEFIGRN